MNLIMHSYRRSKGIAQLVSELKFKRLHCVLTVPPSIPIYTRQVSIMNVPAATGRNTVWQRNGLALMGLTTHRHTYDRRPFRDRV